MTDEHERPTLPEGIYIGTPAEAKRLGWEWHWLLPTDPWDDGLAWWRSGACNTPDEPCWMRDPSKRPVPTVPLEAGQVRQLIGEDVILIGPSRTWPDQWVVEYPDGATDGYTADYLLSLPVVPEGES